ncbi:MAG: branched-chain amino acid ABC transporter permease [Syntrophobacteraceae bacterium]
MQLFWEILVSGFIISSIYALGAMGFSLMFGTAGILNLAHGAYLVLAGIVAWFCISHFKLSLPAGLAVGILASVLFSYLLFFLLINPIDKSKRIREEEKTIFVLTATLLWSIIIQGMLDYFFGSTPVIIPPFASGNMRLFAIHVTYNMIVLALLSLCIIGVLWFVMNRTKAGKMLLAASMSRTGLAIMGIELKRVYLLLWGIYGILAGVSGVLLASFLGASAAGANDLTGMAFSIVVLGGLGSITGSFFASYIIGYLGTMTAYLISPSYTSLPAFLVLVVILFLRPQGLFGRF